MIAWSSTRSLSRKLEQSGSDHLTCPLFSLDYTEGEYGNNNAARDWHLQNTENGDPGSDGDDGGDGGNNGGNGDNEPDSGSARVGFHCLVAVMAIAFALVC